MPEQPEERTVPPNLTPALGSSDNGMESSDSAPVESGNGQYIIVGAVRRVKSRQRNYVLLHHEPRQAPPETPAAKLPPANLKLASSQLGRAAPKKARGDMSRFP